MCCVVFVLCCVVFPFGGLTILSQHNRPLFRQAFQETEFVSFKGWQSAKQILMPHLAEFMTDKEVPPAILLAYNTTKAALKGLHSVSVQVGDNAFHFTAHNADVITFLPTAHELGIEDL